MDVPLEMEDAENIIKYYIDDLPRNNNNLEEIIERPQTSQSKRYPRSETRKNYLNYLVKKNHPESTSIT